jgi:hypothetical protein
LVFEEGAKRIGIQDARRRQGRARPHCRAERYS